MSQPWADTYKSVATTGRAQGCFFVEKLHFWDFPSRDPPFTPFAPFAPCADQLSGPRRGSLPWHRGMKYDARRPQLRLERGGGTVAPLQQPDVRSPSHTTRSRTDLALYAWAPDMPAWSDLTILMSPICLCVSFLDHDRQLHLALSEI